MDDDGGDEEDEKNDASTHSRLFAVRFSDDAFEVMHKDADVFDRGRLRSKMQVQVWQFQAESSSLLVSGEIQTVLGHSYCTWRIRRIPNLDGAPTFHEEGSKMKTKDQFEEDVWLLFSFSARDRGINMSFGRLQLCAILIALLLKEFCCPY